LSGGIAGGPAALGVGITYSTAIEELLHASPELFDLVEIEPQTLWVRMPAGPPHFRVRDDVLAHLSCLPGRKLIHSVGTPVGGAVAPDPEQLRLLADMIQRFHSPWASDHLSYNQTPEFATGFFLPPRQTAAGIAAVTTSIATLQQGLGVPVAVETGVNYLRPRADELPDGAFVAEVVQRADCGLLLDMHNIFTNALNGRQPVDQFLDEIPLERVWEVHLAGGMELDGFWLDAHSGAIPDPLFAICEALVPRLPNLAAIVFEIFPSFVPRVGLELVRAQIERLHQLWALRESLPSPIEQPSSRSSSSRSSSPSPSPPVRLAYVESPDKLPPPAWERALGELVIGRKPSDESAAELAADRGVRVIEGLIHEFRASMIVGVLRLTSRLLMLALGTDAFRTILRSYWSAAPPQMYASLEAEAFAAHLQSLDLAVPHLAEVLCFEQAIAATLTDEQARIVTFQIEPLPLLRALAAGRLPEQPPQPGHYEIELTPDGPAASTGLDVQAVQAAFPYH
jgi:uncharacterized protein (UPF0276 family)